MDSKLTYIREQMPALKNMIYFNNGTAGPLSKAVERAMQETIEQQVSTGRIHSAYPQNLIHLKQEARAALAQLVGCEAAELALTRNTADGMNIVTLGMRWYEGDELITTTTEHFQALLPLYVAQDRFGIQLKFADITHSSEDIVNALEKLITKRTKLISISHVSYNTGNVLPIQDICRMAHQYGVFVLVDGAQAFGAIPVNVHELGCDFYSAPGQKWLCGPEGTGVLYASKAAMPQIYYSYYGNGLADKADFNAGFLLKDTAQRFEQGTMQPANVAGLLTASNWLTQEVGLDWAFARITTLVEQVYGRLIKMDSVRVISQKPLAGLVTFQIPGANADDVVIKLEARKILVRSVPFPDAIRISTGFYNTEDEVTELIAAISSCVNS